MRRRPLRTATARSIKPAVERVEARVLLATFVVTNTNDDTNPGSLRTAITESNATPGSNTIDFAIPSGGVQTIAILTALPPVTVPTTIDGTSQPGYDGTPLIELDGAAVNVGVDGLDLTGGASTVEGLAINRFTNAGISLSVSGGDTITKDYIGTDPTGSFAEGNGQFGVLVLLDSNANTITGNVISGNGAAEINLDGFQSLITNTVTTGNLVTANFIGTDVTGKLSLDNGMGSNDYGIELQNAPDTTIGGTTAAARNIISGINNDIQLGNESDDSVVEGNYIGTDVTGTHAVPKGTGGGVHGDGVVIFGINNSTIGGTVAGAGNLISGNTGYGIEGFSTGDSDLVEGNLIGTDVTGTKPLGNNLGGIDNFGPTNLTIGGTVVGARNVISGNGFGPNELDGDGIGTTIDGAGLLIEGNYIGVDITGTQPLGNGGAGVAANYTGTTIGGSVAGAGNIIANNGTLSPFDMSGIVSTASDTSILSNSIYNNNKSGISQVVIGTNSSLPTPVLTSAVSTGTTSTVVGSLTAPAGSYLLQFFATPGLDAGGNAEGETLLGSAMVTSMNGLINFSEALPSGFLPGEYITSTATDGIGGTSPFSVGIIGTGSGTISGPPTLTVAASGNNIPAGSDVIDTFTITNTSSGPDTGVIFSDAIPINTTFVSGMASNQAVVTVVNGVATVDLGTIAPGAAVTVSIVLGTSTATIPSFTNIGQVVSATPPVFAGQDTASVTTTVVKAADLAVTIIGPTAETFVGQDLVFIVTVTNGGPNLSTGLVLADALPAGTTFVSASETSGPIPTLVNGVLIDNYGDLIVGGGFTLTIVVNAGLGSVPTATDVASVSGNEADANTANNIASFQATIVPLADVSVSILPSVQAVVVGAPLQYLVIVRNAGPSTATNLAFTDVLPAGVTVTSIMISDTSDTSVAILTGQTLTDTIAMLPIGGLVEFAITVIPTASAASMIVDTASALGVEADPNLANNMASATTAVVPVADVALTSQTITPSPAIEGEMVLIAIAVTNNGPSTATGVNVTTTLPVGLTFVSGSADGGAATVSGGVVTAPIGSLALGATSIIMIAVMASTTGALTVSSTVSTTSADANLGNNTIATTVDVGSAADLSIALSGSAGPGFTGDVLAYTAVITNLGPSPAADALFVNPLYAGAQFVGVEANGVAGSVVDGVVEQDLGTIAPGASVTVLLLLTPTLPGTSTDTALATSSTSDPDLANNVATVSTTLITPVSLVTFSSPTYAVDENAGYAAITLVRTGYEEDNVTVHFSTGLGGNATPGVDYLPVSTTVVIPAGSTQATVDVPVLADPTDNHNEIVSLQLDTPTGSAVLEPDPTEASLTIINIDPVLVGPTVTLVKLTGYVNSITSIEIDTTGNLNPTTATNPANYTLTAFGGGGKTGLPLGAVVPVVSATYNASTGAVTLTPAQPLPGNELFLIDVNGSHPGAITDLSGNPLNSVLGTTPGSDYFLTVARGTDIIYSDENNSPVTLTLTGPGTIDIDRYVAGNVMTLQVVGGVTGKTVVTGTAHPTHLRSTIGTILGIGQFGSIRLKMTTPSFYVVNAVYPNIYTVDPPAYDVLLPTPPTPKVTKTKTTKTKASATTSKEVHAAEVHTAKAHPTKAHPAKAHPAKASHHR